MAYIHRNFILFSFLSILSFLVNSSNAVQCDVSDEGITVYWGQETAEGTLYDTCATGNYRYVVLDYLLIYDNGSTPEINFANHCIDCRALETEIKYCQRQNVDVLLSIRSDEKAPSNSNTNRHSSITEDIAKYIYDNFLGGDLSGKGPLGNISLDGIDFSSVEEGDNIKWVDLVKAINESTIERKIYLSASPQCSYPDPWLKEALNTNMFDYIFVEFFYDPSCSYNEGNTNNLVDAWDTWTSQFPTSKVFLGLPASDKATGTGYIDPTTLKEDILPTLKESSNYGGVMLFNRYFDEQSGYSDEIKDNVAINSSCTCVCQNTESGDLLANPSNTVECDDSITTGGIATFWGDWNEEDTIYETCATGNYKYVIIDFLKIYDNGNTPVLNIDFDHCNRGLDGNPNCTNLEKDIKYCQSQNVSVFLSIIGSQSSKTETEIERSLDSNVTKNVAKYIYDNFFGGDLSGQGPLGNVSLDGIELAFLNPMRYINWADFMRAMNETTKDRKIYQVFTIECSYPVKDNTAMEVLNTGLLDYLFVDFYYTESCSYKEGNPDNLLTTWNDWASHFPNSKVFIGLSPTSSSRDGKRIFGSRTWYIDPTTLKEDILPIIKKSSNYGGVSLVERYQDMQSGYSDAIKDNVPITISCKCECQESTSNNSCGLSRQY